MNVKNAAIGPLMEQLVQLVTDVATLNMKMDKIESAFAGLSEIGRKKYQRRAKPVEDDVQEAEAEAPTPRSTNGHRLTSNVQASTVLNTRLRSFKPNDPVRAKITKMRKTKGNVAALAFFSRRFPTHDHVMRYIGKPTMKERQRQYHEAHRKKSPRPDNALRSQFVAAIANLPAQDKKEALKMKKNKGTRAALAWLGNGHNPGSDAQQSTGA